MHRSGTSCLTGMLESSGVWIGEVARKNRRFNPKGNLENVSARKLNNEIPEVARRRLDEPARRDRAGR